MRWAYVLLAAALSGCSSVPVALAVREGFVGAARGLRAATHAGSARRQAPTINGGPPERGRRGWRGLPSRLDLPFGVRKLVLDFLPIRFWLALARWRQLELWEVEVAFLGDRSGRLRPNRSRAKRLRVLHGNTGGDTRDVAFLSGDRMLVETYSRTVQVWSPPFLRPLIEFTKQAGDVVVGASPDGDWLLLTESKDFTVMRSMTSGDVRWKHPVKIDVAAFSPSGDYLAVVDERFAALLNASDGREMCRYDMFKLGREQQIAFNGDRLEVCRCRTLNYLGCKYMQKRRRLVSLRVRYSGDGCVLVRDHAHAPCDDVVLSKGRPLLVQVMNDTASIQNTEEDMVRNEYFAVLNGSYERHVISPDGGSALFTSRSSPPVLWGFTHGREPRTVGFRDSFPPRFSDDGQVLLGQRQLIDLESGEEMEVSSEEPLGMWMGAYRVSRLRCSGMGSSM